MKLFEIATAKNELQQALLKCKNNVGIMLDSSNILYRGLENFRELHKIEIPDLGPVSYMVVPKRTDDRESLTGSNSMMNFTKFSPAWKEVPKRYRSNSCSFNYNTAAEFSGYHGAWIVFPYDTVKSYGYCGQDFNYLTLPRELHTTNNPNVMGFGTILWQLVDAGIDIMNEHEDHGQPKMFALASNLCDSIDTQLTEARLKNASKFIEYIKSTFPKDASENYHLSRFIKSNPDKTLYDAVIEHLTPEAIKVGIANSLSSIPDIEGESEIWFDGAYVAVRCDVAKMTSEKMFFKDTFRRYILGKS